MSMRRKVLIVDDHLINRRILENILEDTYDILTAENGKVAVDILNAEGRNISAVLLDVVMPVMDGYEVLEEVSKNPVLASIPVLVTSYKGGDDSELKALNLGASDFVSKPYNPDILKKRLLNLILMQEATETVNVLERDSLTNLYTQEVFCRKFDDLLKQDDKTEYDIIGIDIMNLKLVNDAYGFDEGNRLIQYIGESIKKQVGVPKLAARAYADHFFMVIQRDEVNEQIIFDSIRTDMKHYPMDMKVHARFGVYPVTNREVGTIVMCERVILSMDSIRGQLRQDVAYYNDSMRTKRMEEQQITDEMAEALLQQQFKVYLQPKYDVKTNKMAGAEALVRWIHPKRGFMPPDMFIPIFEKNGFITELDMYIWDKTCEYIAEWINTEHKYVPVSVNVSRRDIYKPNLVEILKHTVAKHGLEPKHLHLEITESAYTKDAEQLVAVVEQLKAAGFEIEMDDFGSGYSSLNTLAKLPIDILKLDMKFVQNMGEHEKSLSILGSIIQLAKRINLKVIAEGVEEKKQVDMLQAMNCDMIQGYYYAKPMPEPEFCDMLFHE